MRKKRGDQNKWKFKKIRISALNKILLMLLILLVLLSFIYLKLETNCYQDKACFNKLAAQCQKSRITLQEEGNTFQYTIISKETNNTCLVNIKILQLSQNYDQETKNLLEEKEMLCKIPQEKLTALTETEAVIDYCTGPLKEAMYELIIKKIYGVLAENLGPTIKKVEPL